MSAYANGVKIGQVSLPAASGWVTVQQTLPLRAGLNLIGYQYDNGDSGNVALDDLVVAGSADLAARGATVPYTEYEAESSSTNGVVIGPDRTYRTVASESSGRRAVRLDNAGKYTQFTLTKPANSIVVRYSIPDNAAGTGITAPLGVYVGGSKVKDLTLTSAYSWVYGLYRSRTTQVWAAGTASTTRSARRSRRTRRARCSSCRTTDRRRSRST